MNEYEILLNYLNNNVKQKSENKNIRIDANKIIKQHNEINQKKKEINKVGSKNFDVEKFENIIRSRLIDNYKKNQSYEKPFILVTELFYCLRKAFYSRLKYSIDLKKFFSFSYLDLINIVGNSIHSYVLDIYTFSEVEKTIVSEKYKVKDRVDAIYDKCVYQLKIIDQEKINDSYINEDYYQALVYAYILNSEYNYNINIVSLVYFFRDNLKKKPIVFDLPIDDKIAISFLELAPVLQNCILLRKSPQPLNCSSEQCKWCPYIEYCDKDSINKNQTSNKNFKDPIFLL